MGALHQADSDSLRIAASVWHDELATLPKPLLVVNIGGPTSNLYNISQVIYRICYVITCLIGIEIHCFMF